MLDDLIEDLLAGVPVCDPNAGNGEGSYFVEQANETMHLAADELATLRAKLAERHALLDEILATCMTDYGDLPEDLTDRIIAIGPFTGGDNAEG